MLLNAAINIAGKQDRMHYRDGTSDAGIIQQVLREGGYSAFNEEIDRKFKDRKFLIIDGGANIGAAAVYFASLYPNAIVVAVEPESSNFEVLRKNSIGRAIIPMQRALASSSTACEVFHPKGSPIPGCGHAAYQTKLTSNGAIRTITIPEIIAAFQQLDIPLGIVKLDVEGAEKEIFSDNISWVSDVPAMMIELHDYMAPGEGISAPFEAAVDNRFTRKLIGETTCLLNKKVMSS